MWHTRGMSVHFRTRLRSVFAPPRYLSLPFAGFDVSNSGVKAVRLAEGARGITLAIATTQRLPSGAFIDGDIADKTAVSTALAEAARAIGVSSGNISLQNAKSYLFEAVAPDAEGEGWRTAIEQRLDEFVPLPPAQIAFDLVSAGAEGHDGGGRTIVGIGVASSLVSDILAACDSAGVEPLAIEGESFAVARALLPQDDDTTVLVIDIGQTTTKIAIIDRLLPRFSATIDIGGQAFTIAAQKHFGVSEAEAQRVKLERGIVSSPENREYLASLLPLLSGLRDEVANRLDYWQERAATGKEDRIARVLLVGGNASLRGLPEYLETSLRVPVTIGDVFTRFASRNSWVPQIDRAESLTYATAIGLALRDRACRYD